MYELTHGQFGNGIFFSNFGGLTFIHGTDAENIEDINVGFMNPETEEQPSTYEEFIGCCFHLMQQLGGLLLVTSFSSEFNSQFIKALRMEDTSGAPLDLMTEVICDKTVCSLNEILKDERKM